MHIALMHARIRVEERLLIDAFHDRGVELELIDLDRAVFDLDDPSEWTRFDLVLDRCLSVGASLTSVRVLEAFGVRCVNAGHAIETCSDKLQTTLALMREGVPQPRVVVAPRPEGAVEAIERVGYPAVVKPTVGSWGRLVSRVNDRDSAEAIVEHRTVLGSASHQVMYAQEHIDKPGRDLRVFVVGGRAIAGIVRTSEHWVTNTARGGTASAYDVSGEAGRIAERAVEAVGADIAAVDLLECPRRGLLVNEINHSMEFRNSIDTTGVDIPGVFAEHVLGLVGTRRSAVPA